jgi:hypothetical protein
MAPKKAYTLFQAIPGHGNSCINMGALGNTHMTADALTARTSAAAGAVLLSFASSIANSASCKEATQASQRKKGLWHDARMIT